MKSAAPLVLPRGAERSRALFDRLSRSMPGANTRTATYYEPFPLAIDRGHGALVWDLDGNELIDFVNNYTSLVHGHAHPEITAAIAERASRGTVFPAPSLEQAELAERICARVESVDQVRFTNSGTEAAMHAVRCARAATARTVIVKAVNGYHGSWDGALPTPDDTSGVGDGARAAVRWVEFNDVASLEDAMADRGEEVAAILLEPLLGAGVIPGERAFFAAAERVAREYGALLILDEVVTLRLHRAGYQAALGVSPDLTVFGKVIGGGLPIGAFGGRSELMARYDPREPHRVTHHGTFNGNALAMAAGRVSLDLLDDAAIAGLEILGKRLADGLRAAVERHALPAHVTHEGSLAQIHFDVAAPPRHGSELNPASPLLAALHLTALAEGVYIAPRGELNVTTAMDEALIDDALRRLDAAMSRLP